MVEQKQKVAITWLQCQLPRSEWDNLNARRLALKLTWADIIVPGTKKYLDYFEATRAQQAEQQPPEPKLKKPKAKAPAAKVEPKVDDKEQS